MLRACQECFREPSRVRFVYIGGREVASAGNPLREVGKAGRVAGTSPGHVYEPP